MFIGACPGSTGGGIKTTTFTVLAVTVVCTFRGKNESVVLRHRFSTPTVYKAFSLSMVAFLLVFIDAGVISSLNPEILYIDCFYEATSAFGTVGLSASVTPNLDPISKLDFDLYHVYRPGGAAVLWPVYPDAPQGKG